MALTDKSLFLFSFQVTESNSSLDFKAASGGPILQATLTLGFYSLTSLALEIAYQLNATDPYHNYGVSVDRTISGGLQNRVTIVSNGTYFSLLFLTGPRNTSACYSLIGFAKTDRTGSLSYTGTLSAGTAMVTTWYGNNYLPPDIFKKVFGTVNISVSGIKETISYQIQRFTQVEFKYEPQTKVLSDWDTFFEWAIQQREFDFTPEISSPNTFFNVTLESTGYDGKGLGAKMTEMLPDLPFHYTTGLLTMRIVQ